MFHSLKVIFFGTPLFSAKVLSYLLHHEVQIVAVVSKPDKPKGRSGVPVATPVKEVALKYHLPIFQPEKASDPQFGAVLASFDADLFVVVAYGEIMKQHLLDLPKKGCINLHASLLPKYRGAAPIQRAIMEGEQETGVTIMHMVRKMDAGGMITKQIVPIGPDDSFEEIEAALCSIGGPLLFQVITEFEKGKVDEVQQDESQVTYAPKVELEDCEIDWNRSAEAIHNLVRGVYPSPGAWCWVFIKGEKKRLKVLKTCLNEDREVPVERRASMQSGEILSCSENGMEVACGEGEIRILQLQLEGKRVMSPDECYRGSPFYFVSPI